MRVVRVLVENREDEGFDWGRFEYFLLKITRKIPDRIICVSEGVRKVVSTKEKIHPSGLTVIHNGIDLNRNMNTGKDPSLMEELSIPPGSKVVGMVGNLNRPVKGGRYFIDAVPLILKKVPVTHFIIVGGGDEIPALVERTEASGVSHAVHFVGFREDVERYYGIMDISVLTSISEGLSITLLESMSHGLPVVVTEVGGNSEVVVDGVTGYLVPPGDVPSFAEKVSYLLQSADTRESMGMMARERIAKNFQIEVTSSRYEGMYRSVLSTCEMRKQEGGAGGQV
jgi:glycosyltransferase involved in cell wall biosynthesis